MTKISFIQVFPFSSYNYNLKHNFCKYIQAQLIQTIVKFVPWKNSVLSDVIQKTDKKFFFFKKK